MGGNYTLGIAVVAFILVRVYLRQKSGGRPVIAGGLSIFYPLLIYLALIIFAGSKLFVDHSGALVMPPVPLAELIESLLLGAVFALPMILTTNYELRQDGQVYTKANKYFILIIVALTLVRYGLEKVLFTGTNQLTTVLSIFLMLITYLTIWRSASFIKYRKLVKAQIG